MKLIMSLSLGCLISGVISLTMLPSLCKTLQHSGAACLYFYANNDLHVVGPFLLCRTSVHVVGNKFGGMWFSNFAKLINHFTEKKTSITWGMRNCRALLNLSQQDRFWSLQTQWQEIFVDFHNLKFSQKVLKTVALRDWYCSKWMYVIR